MEKNKNLEIIIKSAAFIVVLAVIIFVSVRYMPSIIKLVKSPDKFKAYLLSFGHLSILIFILFQILQVVIAAIPGELVQLSGGFIFGTVLGTLYSIIGIVAGSIIVFFVSRFFGYSLVKLLVPEKEIAKFNNLMNTKKSEFLVFFLFLIPGMPKDILTYVAGLTPIKPVRFLLIITIARLPALIGSSYIGKNLQTQNYIPVIIVGLIAVILFVTGVVFQDKIVTFLHNLTQKKNQEKDDNLPPK